MSTKHSGAHPCVLADDLVVTTVGPEHAGIFEQAMGYTHKFLADMGGEVALTQSYNSSNCADMRN